MCHRPVIRMMAICAVLGVSLTGCSGISSSRLETRISPSRLFRWPLAKASHVEKRDSLEDPFLPEPNTAVAGTRKDKSKPADTQSDLSTESLVLFETEFRDASPQERQEWMEHIRGVPPEMVPQILRARRLALERSALASATPAASSAPSRQALIAGHAINEISPWSNPSSMAQADAQRSSPASTQPISSLSNPVGLDGLENIDPADHDVPYRPASFGRELSAPSPLERHHRQAQGQPIMPALPSASANDSLPTTSSPQEISLAADSRPESFGAPQNLMPQINSGSVYSGPDGSRDGLTQPLMQPFSTTTSTASLPMIAGQPGDANMWNLELTRLISLAEAEAARLPVGTSPEQKRNYIAKHVYLRMLYLMGDQQVRALSAIEGLDAADQEFWQQMFWAMSNYFDEKGLPDPADRASQTIAQLTTAIDRLQTQARLELRNVSFSHKIDGFGSFQRFDRDEFKPGQPVLVYAELRNFKSEPNSQGLFRTMVESRIEIYKAGPSGGLISTQDFPATEDLSSSLRHDYYHSYLLHLPENLTLGPHILKLTVEDQQSNKLASYSLRFGVQ